MDLPSVFGAGCALTRGVSLEYDCAVQEVPAQGEMEVFAAVGLEAYWLHRWEFVDGCENS